MQPGDRMVVPNDTFWMAGGVTGNHLRDIVFQIDGTLKWSNNQTAWPRTPPTPEGKVAECWYLETIDNVTFTSSGTGTLDGNGEGWWGYWNYLIIGENRPRMLHVEDAGDLLIENIVFRQSPYWNVYIHDANGVEIRNSAVEVHRDNATWHDLDDLGELSLSFLPLFTLRMHCHRWLFRFLSGGMFAGIACSQAPSIRMGLILLGQMSMSMM